MKKLYLIICVLAFLTCLTGIPYVVEGIAARGWTGVNYGRVVFPLALSAVSFFAYRRR